MGIRQIGIGCDIQHEHIYRASDVDMYIGDHVYVGPGVRFHGSGRFEIGDYSKIHLGTYIQCRGNIKFGHNTWIGQNCIIDGTGGIRAGNNIGIGMCSHLYTHIRHGDVLNGCRFNSEKKMVLGDDVWFVGQCLVSPITAELRSVALLGSVVTRDMKGLHVYGGNPAKDITDKVGYSYTARLLPDVRHDFKVLIRQYAEIDQKFDPERIAIGMPEKRDPEMVYYDLINMEYTKRNTVEVDFNKWLFTYRAKFVPI